MIYSKIKRKSWWLWSSSIISPLQHTFVSQMYRCIMHRASVYSGPKKYYGETNFWDNWTSCFKWIDIWIATCFMSGPVPLDWTTHGHFLWGYLQQVPATLWSYPSVWLLQDKSCIHFMGKMFHSLHCFHRQKSQVIQDLASHQVAPWPLGSVQWFQSHLWSWNFIGISNKKN